MANPQALDGDQGGRPGDGDVITRSAIVEGLDADAILGAITTACG